MPLYRILIEMNNPGSPSYPVAWVLPRGSIISGEVDRDSHMLHFEVFNCPCSVCPAQYESADPILEDLRNAIVACENSTDLNVNKLVVAAKKFIPKDENDYSN